MNKKVKKVEELDELEKEDIYSLVLFALWEIRKVPEYASLSELCYVLDNRSFLRFLDYFGGQTITIPTKLEFRILVQSLLLYQMVDLEDKAFSKALESLDDDIPKNVVKSTYIRLKEILSKYNFRREKDV